MASSLMERMLKVKNIDGMSTIDKSELFEKDIINTGVPIIDVAFSGELDGGFTTGLTVFAGESKCFKSLLALYCIRSYFNKYPESICIFYDSELGITPEYLRSNGIDTTRVLHMPISDIEVLKFDMVERLNEINRGDRVFFFVDSLGLLASNKETEDAQDKKIVADMTRAKAIRSLFRLVTQKFAIKDIPCIMINHIYKETGMFPKTIISGGTSVMLSANQAFIISKSQEKDGTDLVGWNFTINIEKSRFIREKSKLTFTVTYEDGIQKYSGLLDIALDSGYVTKRGHKYYHVDKETGEIKESSGVKGKDVNVSKEFWEPLLNNLGFRQSVADRYKLAGSIINDDLDASILDEESDIDETYEETNDE